MGKSNRQSGLTLIEILVASAISGIVAITIGSLFIFTMRQFSTLVLQSQTQQELQWMGYHLQSMFTQSMNKKLKINYYNMAGSDSSYSCPIWDGGATCGHTKDDKDNGRVKIASILTDRMIGFAKVVGSGVEIEKAASNVGDNEHKSYLYYIEPYANKPGVLCIVFSLGKASITLAQVPSLHDTACNLSLSDNAIVEVQEYSLGFKLAGLEIDIQKVPDPSVDDSMLVDITLHSRYFLTSSKKGSGEDRGHRYCVAGADDPNKSGYPVDPDDPKACDTNVNWRDIQHKVQVNLRNNIFEDYENIVQISGPDEVVVRAGTYGKILFYKMGLPATSYLAREP